LHKKQSIPPTEMVHNVPFLWVILLVGYAVLDFSTQQF